MGGCVECSNGAPKKDGEAAAVGGLGNDDNFISPQGWGLVQGKGIAGRPEIKVTPGTFDYRSRFKRSLSLSGSDS